MKALAKKVPKAEMFTRGHGDARGPRASRMSLPREEGTRFKN